MTGLEPSAAATAARMAAEGGAARLDLRGRGLEAVPADVWDMAAPGISFIDLGEGGKGGRGRGMG